MVESVLALLVLVFAVLAVAQFADGLYAKLLLENAAARCARARAVGFNDFMLLKIARLSTMPVSGRCLTQNEHGDTLSRAACANRIGDYLSSRHETHAKEILNFDYWQEQRLDVSAIGANPLSVTVTQRRPTFFSMADWLQGRGGETEDASISGHFQIESHAPDYLQ